MSRPRFLADQDLNEHIVEGVRQREPTVEFILARDVGLKDSPDPTVLEFAAVHGYLLVSHDASSMPAHAHRRMTAGKSVRGLFIARQIQSIGPVIEDLVMIWSASEAEEWRDQVVFLPL